MSPSIIWIIVAVVVVVVAVAVVAAVMRNSKTRKLEKRRTHAHEIRESAAVHSETVQERETEAASTEARAQEVRAEADARAREAERLETVAGEHRHRADAERVEYDEQIRRADEIDPDVRTTEGTDAAGHTDRGVGSDPATGTYDERAYDEHAYDGRGERPHGVPEQRTEGGPTGGTHRA